MLAEIRCGTRVRMLLINWTTWRMICLLYMLVYSDAYRTYAKLCTMPLNDRCSINEAEAQLMKALPSQSKYNRADSAGYKN
jgi:hypothetical protein